METFPGANIASDADIENVLRTALMYPSFAHPCAMLPLDKGGVVSPGLRLYGPSLLSVVDASVQTIVYAIAETVCG